VKKFERYFENYVKGDGWFGLLEDEAMKALALRMKTEGRDFLHGRPLEKA
jgi:hypothetical protein